MRAARAVADNNKKKLLHLSLVCALNGNAFVASDNIQRLLRT